mmetsp:Transcript_1237/g.2048  ORF Transcript_1237/g.2048 Transcript_1237/m.2048 type:complete len:90 (+) Transcript_1237:2092-2361(+)
MDSLPLPSQMELGCEDVEARWACGAPSEQGTEGLLRVTGPNALVASLMRGVGEQRAFLRGGKAVVASLMRDAAGAWKDCQRVLFEPDGR